MSLRGITLCSEGYFIELFKNKFELHRYYAIYEFVMIYLGIAGGVVKGIARFILAIIISSFTFNFITEPLTPFWVENMIKLDNMCKSYYSMIYMYHLHNNPIFVTAANILLESFLNK